MEHTLQIGFGIIWPWVKSDLHLGLVYPPKHVHEVRSDP